MKPNTIIVGIIIVFFIISSACSHQSDFPVLKGPFLGQKPPGMVPEVFAQGIISNAGFHLHSSLAFSPDGREIYFTKFVSEPNVKGTIYCMKQDGDRWTEPRTAFFSGRHNDDSAVFTPDGKRLYFTSNRPHGNYEESTNMNIWFVEKTETGWSEPIFEENVNNPGSSEWRLAFSKDGTMYLTSGSSRPKIGMYSFDIYVSHYNNGRYTKSQKLDQDFNTSKSETCCIVEPDEGYMIFYRYDSNYPDELGLYLSYRDKSGNWTEGKNMGELFNSGMESVTQAASLSPDCKYLFFLKRMEESIYWIDAKIIKDLIPDDFE